MELSLSVFLNHRILTAKVCAFIHLICSLLAAVVGMVAAGTVAAGMAAAGTAAADTAVVGMAAADTAAVDILAAADHIQAAHMVAVDKAVAGTGVARKAEAGRSRVASAAGPRADPQYLPRHQRHRAASIHSASSSAAAAGALQRLPAAGRPNPPS